MQPNQNSAKPTKQRAAGAKDPNEKRFVNGSWAPLPVWLWLGFGLSLAGIFANLLHETQRAYVWYGYIGWIVLVIPVQATVRRMVRDRSARLTGQGAGARFVHDVVTVWCAGHIPKGSGTLGAIAAFPVVFATAAWPLWARAALIAALTAISLAAVASYLKTAHSEDPSEVVIDEFVGYLIAVQAAPAAPLWIGAAFLLFRLFDIVKPWPICWTERLPGTWGVMFDDIVAGAMAAAVVAMLVSRLAG